MKSTWIMAGAACLLVFAAPATSQDVSTMSEPICYICTPCQWGREATTEGLGTIDFLAPPQPIGCMMEDDCTFWTSQFPPCYESIAAAEDALDRSRQGDRNAVIRFAALHSEQLTLIEDRRILILRSTCSGQPVFALPVAPEQVRAVRNSLRARRVAGV